MSDKFSSQGQWTVVPQTGSLLASGATSLTTPVKEDVTLALYNGPDVYKLVADAVQAVAFGGVANANVVEITSDRKIKVRLTSADGALQIIAVDGKLELISRTAPYTAIDLQRVAGQETTVRVFIGQKS